MIFMRQGKFIRLLSFSQYTPLHKSAEYGHLETCRLLLRSNARVDAADDM
jgi:ankyrin repeat protein